MSPRLPSIFPTFGIIRHLLLLITATTWISAKEPLETPHPRTPPVRSFEMLPSQPITLERAHYVDFLRSQPRYGAEDYSRTPPAIPPLKTDDKTFYEWLIKQKIPREFAEMIYMGAPETSFLEGSGYVNGVDAIIAENSSADQKNIRDAGFFIVGSGPNGDFLVVDVAFKGTGEVGFFPIETTSGKTPAQLREMFIPIVKSLGDYIRIHNSPDRLSLPMDYWAAKAKKESKKK